MIRVGTKVDPDGPGPAHGPSSTVREPLARTRQGRCHHPVVPALTCEGSVAGVHGPMRTVTPIVPVGFSPLNCYFVNSLVPSAGYACWRYFPGQVLFGGRGALGIPDATWAMVTVIVGWAAVGAWRMKTRDA
jgi:hypothetical protein